MLLIFFFPWQRQKYTEYKKLQFTAQLLPTHPKAHSSTIGPLNLRGGYRKKILQGYLRAYKFLRNNSQAYEREENSPDLKEMEWDQKGKYFSQSGEI